MGMNVRDLDSEMLEKRVLLVDLGGMWPPKEPGIQRNHVSGN